MKRDWCVPTLGVAIALLGIGAIVMNNETNRRIDAIEAKDAAATEWHELPEKAEIKKVGTFFTNGGLAGWEFGECRGGPIEEQTDGTTLIAGYTIYELREISAKHFGSKP